MDDTPDYSKCSLRELHDVAARIDKGKYPDRYALVLREIERRESLGEETPNVPMRALVLKDIPNVLMTMIIGTVMGAAMGGGLFYVIFPPYISDYGDGVGAGVMILLLAFIGAIIGAIAGLIRVYAKFTKE